jgi:hypothetical protein
MSHLQKLTKGCVTNREDTNNYKQYFPNSLKGWTIKWFTKYETTYRVATWDKVQWTFKSRFNDVRNERQVIATLPYAKKKKYKSIKDYYDRFLQLCARILKQPDDIYLRVSTKSQSKGLEGDIPLYMTMLGVYWPSGIRYLLMKIS